MSGARARRRAAVPLALAVAGLAVSCGTASSPATPAARAAWPAVSLNTAVATPAGTWAVVVMGGPAARHDDFWQLAVRRAGSARWRVVTPPGTADNGGLLLAPAGQRMIAGFRPSQDLQFTPLITTTDAGVTWSSSNPLTGAAVNTPAALAGSASGSLLALLTDGTVTTAAPGYGRWRTMTSRRVLAATPAGRRCGLTTLTAAAYTGAGTPLLAGTCGRQGTAGIFSLASGTWQLTGPALPGALARETVTVLALSTAGNQATALLAAGNLSVGQLLAAWTADDGRHWTLSPALPLRTARVTSAAFWAGGAAVQLTGRRGDTITPGHSWQELPALPAGTRTLAPGTKPGVTDALSVHRGTLTIWQTGPGTGTWTAVQAITVPIEYGSSG